MEEESKGRMRKKGAKIDCFCCLEEDGLCGFFYIKKKCFKFGDR